MKKSINIFLLLFAISIPGLQQALAQNDLRLNTYHISPRGKYSYIRLLPRPTITDSCSAAIAGTFYIDSNQQNSLFFCNPSTTAWSPTTGVWQETGSIVSPSDTAHQAQLRVGIGTNTPEFKLTIKDENNGMTTAGNGSIVAPGRINSGATLSRNMQWAKFVWYPRKAAVMAGSFRMAFNDANIGLTTTNFSFSHQTPNNSSTAYGKGTDNVSSPSILGQVATIGGGYNNFAPGAAATVAGGSGASASGAYSFAGSCGNVSGDYAGLLCNNITSSGNYSFSGVSFGDSTGILSGDAGVMGAIYNGGTTPSRITGAYAVIGGGGPHVAEGDYSTILGGGNLINVAAAHSGASADYAVLAGEENTVNPPYGTILNGKQNLVNFTQYVTVFNSYQGNQLSTGPGEGSTLFSGEGVSTHGQYSFGQGKAVQADQDYSVIANGQTVTANGPHAFIAGGHSNEVQASALPAVVLGDEISSSADYSFAAGRRLALTAAADNTFVWSNGDTAWAGGTTNPVNIPDANSFIVLANTVGIQTTAPDTTSRVHVNGSVRVDGGYLQTELPTVSGTPTFLYHNDTSGVVGSDIAEIFPCRETVSPGDVLVLAKKSTVTLEKSRKAYDPDAIGVVSAAPASVFEGSQLIIAPEPFRFTRGKKPPVALAGRVLVNVSLENGPIQPGDLLTTSGTPGHAMRATDTKKAHHAVIGKALEAFTGDPKNGQKGLIEMMVMTR